MAKTVKMADIAARLNVSTVTVSKALSNQKGVSEEVREKIKQLAEQMGYQKPSTRNEERTQSFNIGVIVPNAYITKYETFYWEMYQDINTSAAQNNSFVMLEILADEDENQTIPPKLLRENKIDGLIVMGGLRSSYLQMIREHYSTPTVFLDFYDAEIIEDAIVSNSYFGSYQVTNYLFSKGHTKIGFVGTILTTNSITDRYLGYVKSMMEHGETLKEEWRVDDRDLDRRCYEIIPLPKDMPTAFVCNCDMMASKLIRSLQEAGYRVPEDVSVVGFDDFLYPGLCEIPLTTYSVNMNKMAESSVKLLIKKMNGRDTSHGIHMVEGHFVERRSVRELR